MSATSVSRWLETDTYSPIAMAHAPARRPATPAVRMAGVLVGFAAATPMQMPAPDTKPSLAPRTPARSQFSRAPSPPKPIVSGVGVSEVMNRSFSQMLKRCYQRPSVELGHDSSFSRLLRRVLETALVDRRYMAGQRRALDGLRPVPADRAVHRLLRLPPTPIRSIEGELLVGGIGLDQPLQPHTHLADPGPLQRQPVKDP